MSAGPSPDDLLYRIAPTGKAAQDARKLASAGAFLDPRVSADGTWLLARCRGSSPKPYTVVVDRADPDNVVTTCNCASYQQPCKHALGLLFLALTKPEQFKPGEPPAAVAAVRQARQPPRPARVRKQRPPGVYAAQEAALLQAILERREDEAPRLIYADWLEEHGDGPRIDRAEFIRVQCRLAALDPADPQADALKAREKKLLAKYRDDWLGQLPPKLPRTGLVFRRGFVEELRLQSEHFLKYAPKVCERHPVHRARLSGALTAIETGKLAVCPALAHLTVLELDGNKVSNPRALGVLLDTPYLNRLTTLSVRGIPFGTRAAAVQTVLAGLPRMTRLTTLRLDNDDVGDAGAGALAEMSYPPSLANLSLADNRIASGGATALVTSSALAHLTRLDLTGNLIGDGGKRVLREISGDRVVF